MAVFWALLAGILAEMAATQAHAGSAPWLKVEAPTFTILTDMSEADALKRAEEFWQFTQALSQIIPADPARMPRLTVVYFRQQSDFSAYRPTLEKGKEVEVGGFFFREPDALWAMAAFGGYELNKLTRKTFFHEGAHWFLGGLNGPRPIWAEEGVAEVFSTFQVESNALLLGMPEPMHTRRLRTEALIPMATFLSLRPGQLFSHGEPGNLDPSLAYAQSWAFMHMLLFGRHGLPKQAFAECLKIASERSTEEALRRAIGLNFEQLERRLVEYVVKGECSWVRIRHFPRPALMVIPAQKLEIDDALARIAMIGRQFPLAQKHIDAQAEVAPDDARTWVNKGLLFAWNKQYAEATAAFDEAIKRNPADYLSYYYSAENRHLEGRNAGVLQPKVARLVANRYKRAINLNPWLQSSYGNLGLLMAYLEDNIDRDVEFLRHGQKLFGDDARIALGLAVAEARQDGFERVRARVEAIAADGANSTWTRNEAQKLLDRWSAHAVVKSR